MPNVMKVLKDEIVRLARKEFKTPAGKLHRETVGLKRALATFRRQFAQLQREVKRLGSAQSRRSEDATEETEGKSKFRFSVKGVRGLRRKLGLSQAQFASLLGVSPLSVYNWEHKPGRLTLRQTTKQRLSEIRGIGRREALKRLEESKPRGKKRAGGKKRTKRK